MAGLATTEIVATVVRKHAWLFDANAELPMDASFTELGVDSMSIITIAMELEAHLGCTIPDSLFTSEVFYSPSTLRCALNRLLQSEYA